MNYYPTAQLSLIPSDCSQFELPFRISTSRHGPATAQANDTAGRKL
jgi:hypothetical protein